MPVQDSKNFIRTFNAFIAENAHTDAAIYLAAYLGDKDHRRILSCIADIHDYLGVLPQELYMLRHKIFMGLYDALKKTEPETHKQLN